jgi:hypothetical protein
MSTRAKLRRKVVLAVSIIRCTNQEKQLAHTLDITESSARLGGLTTRFESGEMIDIQRGAIRARFQVVWMGKAGTPTERQAGVRAMEPKVIWGVDLPGDERDTNVDINNLRANAKIRNIEDARKPVRPAVSVAAAASASLESKVPPPTFGVETHPARVLTTVCRSLAFSFDAWKESSSPAEIEELRQALSQLQQRLGYSYDVEVVDYLSTTLQSTGRA